MSMQPPHLLLTLSDGPRALADAAILTMSSPLLRRLKPARHPQSVMVIPGFLGDDRGNAPLIKFLQRLGHTASGWGQGRNLGAQGFSQDQLRETMEPLIAAGNGKIALIGHSLGGIYAREIARAAPELVSQVITLGSPFGAGRQHASRVSRLYQRLNPQVVDRHIDDNLSLPPPVPTTAIYTKADGIVNWRTSRQSGAFPHVHNIEVLGSHIGLNRNAAVWYWVAKKLAES
jgi:pimeloyl-ACP methyl ester carboxylesterase